MYSIQIERVQSPNTVNEAHRKNNKCVFDELNCRTSERHLKGNMQNVKKYTHSTQYKRNTNIKLRLNCSLISTI